jgi:hypothetical protein
MAVNTTFLGSGLTQQFTGSDASFAGNVYVAGELIAAGGVGSSAAAPVTISSATYAIVAMTATGNKSVTTTVAWTGAAISTTNPAVYLATPSNLSADVILTVRPTASNVLTLYYSNVSGTQAVVAANTVRITQLQF